IKKKVHLVESPALDFCCDLAILMLYYKCEDNVRDSSFFPSIRWRIARLFAKPAAKKAALRRSKADTAVREAMERQAAIEADPCATTDLACDPTAQSLGLLFEMMGQEEPQRRVLFRLGYMLGRYV